MIITLLKKKILITPPRLYPWPACLSVYSRVVVETYAFISQPDLNIHKMKPLDPHQLINGPITSFVVLLTK